MKRLLMSAWLGAVLSMSAPSFASPLADEIAHARKVDPNAFVNVTAVLNAAPDAHASARSRKAPVAQTLARLGPAAVLPILERLPTETRPVVRRDLIEAAGLLADARAEPLLTNILSSASEDAETTRTTAEALARIGTDSAAAHILSALGAANAERQHAIVAGMGEMRKLAVTNELAARVRTGDDAMVRAAARSLGRSGNAWAWKTLANHTDETAIRSMAATALVDAFVHHTGDARQAASNAILVVDAAITPSLIAQARNGADAETQTALDALAARFARNPVHQ